MAAVELEQRFCLQAKTIHRISCNHPFLTVSTHWVMDTHTPLSGLVLHPAYRHSCTISPLHIKRFFIGRLGRTDLLYSANHHGYSSHTNLCMPLKVACFGESCLTIGIPIVVQHSLSRMHGFLRCWCSSGAPRFCRTAKADISTKRSRHCQHCFQQSHAGNSFRSTRNALCGAAPIKFYSYEKSLQQAHEFFSCCFDDALLDGPWWI